MDLSVVRDIVEFFKYRPVRENPGNGKVVTKMDNFLKRSPTLCVTKYVRTVGIAWHALYPTFPFRRMAQYYRYIHHH